MLFAKEAKQSNFVHSPMIYRLLSGLLATLVKTATKPKGYSDWNQQQQMLEEFLANSLDKSSSNHLLPVKS